MDSTRACRTLLRLYPNEFQALFAAEILDAVALKSRPILRELAPLLVGAGVEWAAKLHGAVSSSNGYLSDFPLYDPHQMRPAGVTWDAFLAGIERKKQGKAQGKKRCS